MKTFILLSFAFLAIAFYEMSGGADFSPPDRLASAKAPAPTGPELAPALPETAQLVRSEQPDAPDREASIGLAAIVPADVQAQTAATQQVVAREVIDSAPEPEVSQATAGAVTLVSLEQSSEFFAQPIGQVREEIETAAAPPAGDLRMVEGSRVNMRSGPGTQYGVVGQLVRGDEVLVFEEADNGWLRLRGVDDQTVGWMAGSLVSD